MLSLAPGSPAPALPRSVIAPVAPRPTASPWGWWQPAVLVAWALALGLYGIDATTLYRTEALRAQIAREALDGSWLVPRLYGEPFLTKPPGMYLAIAVCSWPFGEVTAWSARLPSVLAGVACVLACWSLLRRCMAPLRAFLAALTVPVAIPWLNQFPSAEIDPLQLTWVLLALTCVLHAMDGARRPTLCWLGAMLCVTAGFLTKWTAPAFFYLTLIPFLCLRGQLSHLWSRGHLLGALLAVLLVTGWALEVSRQVGWEVLLDTVRREAMQRVTPAGAGKGFPWKAALGFIPLVLMSNLPWSLPALLTLRRGFRASLSDRERTLWLFCHCWLWPNLLFWSMLSQHSLRYVLPVTPAFTLLGLLWWQRSLAHLSPRSLVRGAVLVCLGWVCVKAVCVEWVFPERTRHRQVRETAGRLRELVPSGEILYHGQLKDEGLMFYYARPTRKFPAPPGRYLLLTEAEWRQVAARPGLHLLADLRDQQRDAIYLVHAPAGALP